MHLCLRSYDNGYRPTAFGRYGDHEFVFRAQEGKWFFGVARDGVSRLSWWSADDELAFSAVGSCDSNVRHTDSVRWFLEGLGRYFEHLGMKSGQSDSVVESARKLAVELFERESNAATCDECRSLYFGASSKMAALCPECAHWRHGNDRCEHVFENGPQPTPGVELPSSTTGRCRKCYWDGSISEFVWNKMLKSGGLPGHSAR